MPHAPSRPSRLLLVALINALVLSSVPAAGAVPPSSLGERPRVLQGRDLTVAFELVEYDPGSGTGHVTITVGGGSWFFRPEIDDEVVVGVQLKGVADVRVERGGRLRLASFDGVADVTVGSGKGGSLDVANVLFTTPGERGFYIDDFIIGATGNPMATYSGVNGLLLPAVN
jgi:hypothetical protein